MTTFACLKSNNRLNLKRRRNPRQKRNPIYILCVILIVILVLILVFVFLRFIYFYFRVLNRNTAKLTEENNEAFWKPEPIYSNHILPQKINENRQISEPISIPQWITDYIAFHNDMRKKFPDKELFTNPDAPKLLVRLCSHMCGGLHDRLGQLPLDLVIANQTQRILLIQWHKPAALENYLIPNAINWTVPHNVGYDDKRQANKHKDFPYKKTLSITKMDEAIRNVRDGDLSHERCLNLEVLGDERGELISSRLQLSNETDMIEDTLTFGRIFRLFFNTHPNVQDIINEEKRNLQLSTGKYIAIHCRVRHPKGWPQDRPPPRAEVEHVADKSDIVFDGYEKEHTIEVATHAVQCARTMLEKNNLHEPIYLSTDTFKLTNHMLGAESPFNQSEINLVSRSDVIPSVHIDRTTGLSLDRYYGTFVDLFLLVDARCVSFGIGNFGRFAAKISGTQCVNQHRDVEWDTHDAPKWFAPACRKGQGIDEEMSDN